MTVGLSPFAVFTITFRKVGCGPPYFMPSGTRMSFWARLSSITRISWLIVLPPNDTEILRPFSGGPHSTRSAAEAGIMDTSPASTASQKRPIHVLDTGIRQNRGVMLTVVPPQYWQDLNRNVRGRIIASGG